MVVFIEARSHFLGPYFTRRASLGNFISLCLLERCWNQVRNCITRSFSSPRSDIEIMSTSSCGAECVICKLMTWLVSSALPPVITQLRDSAAQPRFHPHAQMLSEFFNCRAEKNYDFPLPRFSIFSEKNRYFLK